VSCDLYRKKGRTMAEMQESKTEQGGGKTLLIILAPVVILLIITIMSYSK